MSRWVSRTMSRSLSRVRWRCFRTLACSFFLSSALLFSSRKFGNINELPSSTTHSTEAIAAPNPGTSAISSSVNSEQCVTRASRSPSRLQSSITIPQTFSSPVTVTHLVTLGVTCSYADSLQLCRTGSVSHCIKSGSKARWFAIATTRGSPGNSVRILIQSPATHSTS